MTVSVSVSMYVNTCITAPFSILQSPFLPTHSLRATEQQYDSSLTLETTRRPVEVLIQSLSLSLSLSLLFSVPVSSQTQKLKP